MYALIQEGKVIATSNKPFLTGKVVKEEVEKITYTKKKQEDGKYKMEAEKSKVEVEVMEREEQIEISEEDVQKISEYQHEVKKGKLIIGKPFIEVKEKGAQQK